MVRALVGGAAAVVVAVIGALVRGTVVVPVAVVRALVRGAMVSTVVGFVLRSDELWSDAL
jgi:hypothetical protein